jgi:hypothetical protein
VEGIVKAYMLHRKLNSYLLSYCPNGTPTGRNSQGLLPCRPQRYQRNSTYTVGAVWHQSIRSKETVCSENYGILHRSVMLHTLATLQSYSRF